MQKAVQGATKPKKNAAPKAKYIDPIVQSTFGDTAAFQEVLRALQAQLRSENAVVVHKSLVVLHTLLRSGNHDTVFSTLSTSALSLSMPKSNSNMVAYAGYISARLKSYSNLQRDVIRDKTDRRAPTRLRSLTVEKGLLREVRETQRMIAAAVEAKFYLDDVDDDVAMTSLRLVVKDLLVLFTAVNEGVINVLEHYFEMSHIDASTALKIYKTFVRDTEKVVSYLGVAKKMHNILQVQIPNLKHAPVGLVSSLEEYLNDPNFEKNRAEYRENKRIADGGAPSATSTSAAASSSTATTSNGTAKPSEATSQTEKKPQNFTDFFESIEEAQQPMFPNSPAMPTGFQPYAMSPFAAAYGTQQFIQPQATGNPFAAFGGLQPQMTGYMQPQMTGFAQPQMSGFMQPQMTGANPFRMSMMQPQMTGNPFMRPQMTGMPPGPPPQMMPNGQNAFGMQPQRTGMSPFASGPPQQQSSPSFSQSQAPSPFSSQAPSQPAATSQAPQTSSFTSQAPPATSTSSSAFGNGATNGTSAPALVPQKTGARNPFAPAPGTVINAPSEPKKPSMNEMAQNAFQRYQQQQRELEEQQKQQPQQSNARNGTSDAFDSIFGSSNNQPAPSALAPVKTGLMGSIASDFTLNRNNTGTPPTSAFSSMNISSAASPPPASSSFASTPSALASQPTGFGGRKAFQPTSEFGSKLASEIAATPLSFSAATHTTGSLAPSSTGFGGAGGPTFPLSSQATGFNPFRSSVAPGNPGSTSAFGQTSGSTFGGGSTSAYGTSNTGTLI